MAYKAKARHLCDKIQLLYFTSTRLSKALLLQARQSKRLQNVRKVGGLPLWLLGLSIIPVLAFVGYISFLWFATDGNTTWRKISLSGWMTRSVAIAAVALSTAVTVQGGIASSMLAGLLLEGPGVVLPKLAVVPLMRASSPAPYTLLRHTWADLHKSNGINFGLAAAVLIATLLLQFTSTILLVDINIGLARGYVISR